VAEQTSPLIFIPMQRDAAGAFDRRVPQVGLLSLYLRQCWPNEYQVGSGKTFLGLLRSQPKDAETMLKGRSEPARQTRSHASCDHRISHQSPKWSRHALSISERCEFTTRRISRSSEGRNIEFRTIRADGSIIILHSHAPLIAWMCIGSRGVPSFE